MKYTNNQHWRKLDDDKILQGVKEELTWEQISEKYLPTKSAKLIEKRFGYLEKVGKKTYWIRTWPKGCVNTN